MNTRMGWAVTGLTGLLGFGQASAGTLVVIGGALEPTNAAIYREVVRGAGEDPICVLGTASEDPEASAAGYVKDFRGYGARAQAVAITADNAARSTKDPRVVAQLGACGGYFFVGGDQSRITEAFLDGTRDTPALAVLRDRFEAGAVVAGTSAGAAMMSRTMITGGSSLDTLTNGKDAVTLAPGLGLADDVVFDQHFLERGRFGRLLGALEEAELTLGAGVGEDTALVVPEAGPWRVVGSGHVGVLEVPEPAPLARPQGVELSLLAHGDRFNPESGRFTVLKAREDVESVGYYYEAGDIFAVDAFGPGVLVDLAERLVDSPETEASALAFAGHAAPSFTSQGVRLTLRKTPRTVGYWGRLEVGEEYSVVRLRLSTSPVRVQVTPVTP